MSDIYKYNYTDWNDLFINWEDKNDVLEQMNLWVSGSINKEKIVKATKKEIEQLFLEAKKDRLYDKPKRKEATSKNKSKIN